MSIDLVTPDQYLNHCDQDTAATIGEMFGTETFCHFLYSIVRMDRPSVVVELGCGGAATTLMVCKALSENGSGHCWTIDNGADWKLEYVRRACQSALGTYDADESYGDFVRRLLARMRYENVATLVEMNLDASHLFDPGRPIDMLFADALPSNVEGCLAVLRYYLPRVAPYSSVFIDQAGTIHHSRLFLQYIVDRLNHGKIPWRLIDGLDAPAQQALQQLVTRCDFQLINLTESKQGKRNKPQNSRAWIKIQPVDDIPHNDVVSFGSITRPWDS